MAADFVTAIYPTQPPPPLLKPHPLSPSGLYSSLPSLLPTLLLSLKFLEFYNSPTSPFALLSPTPTSVSSSNTSQKPLLPPPLLPYPFPGGQKLLDGKGQRRKWDDCPICGECWRGRSPCVNGRIGGMVYCWGCAWDWVGKQEDEKGEGKAVCPVTRREMKREELRKLLV
jgi:hypothetical protein